MSLQRQPATERTRTPVVVRVYRHPFIVGEFALPADDPAWRYCGTFPNSSAARAWVLSRAFDKHVYDIREEVARP